MWKLKKNGSFLTNKVDMSPSIKQLTQIIAFDLDHTLIEPISNNKFSKNPTDFKFRPNVLETLRKLNENPKLGLVIFTNQYKTPIDAWIEKMNSIFTQLGFDIKTYASLKKDKYRKPCNKIWKYYKKYYISDMMVLKKSIYVGDAAGRNTDFSDSDLKFAYNCKINFQCPEQFFDNKYIVIKPPVHPILDNKIYLKNNHLKYPKVDHQEMIIMVGSPASGKSTFTQTHFENYVRINQDTLKTKKKCLELTDKQLELGKSVVIDNTNPNRETRKLYIDIAKKYNVPIRCFWLNVPIEIIRHLNKVRTIMGAQYIPDIAINIFFKKFEEPLPVEGFDLVVSVDFTVNYVNKKEKNVFAQYL